MSVCRVFHHIVSISLGHTVSTMTFDRIAASMPLDHIVATMTLDTIAAFDIIVAFDMPLVALLASSSVMWRKEHL
jgi:hypothetical protein